MGLAVAAFERFVQALQVLGQAVLAFMAVTVAYDALARYFFAAPTSWSLEVNGFLLVYLALMTAADVERQGEHINIDLALTSLGGGAARATRAVICALGAIFAGLLAWRGWLMVHDAWIYEERVSSSFGTPLWIPYLMLPVGFGALGLQFIINAGKNAVGGNRDA